MSAVGTKQRVQALLRTVGPVTADEMAERLGLSRAEVRMALAELAPRDMRAEQGDPGYLSAGPIVPLGVRDRVGVRGGPTGRAFIAGARS